MNVNEVTYTPKHKVVFCEETFTVEEALTILRESGYRSVPVLDNTRTKFRGLIYKIDLVEFLFEKEGNSKESIQSLIRDKTACIKEDAFFAEALSIKRLPFLAIVNDRDEFVGILTHNHVMELIEDALGFKSGGFHLTVATQEHKGALKKLTKILDRYNIEGIFTYDNADPYLRRIMVTLPENTPIDQVTEKMESHGFRITHVDKIQTKNKRELRR